MTFICTFFSLCLLRCYWWILNCNTIFGFWLFDSQHICQTAIDFLVSLITFKSQIYCIGLKSRNPYSRFEPMHISGELFSDNHFYITELWNAKQSKSLRHNLRARVVSSRYVHLRNIPFVIRSILRKSWFILLVLPLAIVLAEATWLVRIVMPIIQSLFTTLAKSCPLEPRITGQGLPRIF